jgi:hypothetical protein
MFTLAYLDANSGSLIVSALAAGTAGVGVVARVGWRRVKSKVTRSAGTETAHDEEASATDG